MALRRPPGGPAVRAGRGQARCWRTSRAVAGARRAPMPSTAVEGGGHVAAAVAAKDELVEITPQVLARKAVIDAEAPALEIREDPVGPLQHDMGGHPADHLRLVDVAWQARIGGPAIRDEARAGGGDGGEEGLQRRGGEVLDRGEADAAGPAVRRELHRPGDNHLAPRACGRRRRPADRPCGAAASRSRPPPRCPPAGWARDRPSRGRSLWSSSQAVLQLPRPSWACNCRAEMPLEWLVRMWMAVNQTFRATCLRCMIVPAVREVCLPQAAHSQVKRLAFSAQPFAPPQAGQTNPSGQRRRARWAAQGGVIRQPRLELGAREGAVMLPAVRHGRNITRTSAPPQPPQTPHIGLPEPRGEAFGRDMNSQPRCSQGLDSLQQYASQPSRRPRPCRTCAPSSASARCWSICGCRAMPPRRPASRLTSTTRSTSSMAISSCRCSTPITTSAASCRSTLEPVLGPAKPGPGEAGTGRPVATILWPGKTPTGKEVRGHLRRLLRRIRARWPATGILVRGDSHYRGPEVMAWCEDSGIDYVFGRYKQLAVVDDVRGVVLDVEMTTGERPAKRSRRRRPMPATPMARSMAGWSRAASM